MSEYVFPWSKLKPGLKLQADGGFTCLAPGEIVEVRKDEKTRDLYVNCAGPEYDRLDGDDISKAPRTHTHWLEGQRNFNGDELEDTCVGFRIVE